MYVILKPSDQGKNCRLIKSYWLSIQKSHN
jgi:hypothetical protein